MPYFILILTSLIFITNSIKAYEYNPFEEKINHFEIGVNAGYSIITHEKSIFWANSLNYGFSLGYNIDNKNTLEISANYSEIRPHVDNREINRNYRYRIYPLSLNYFRNIGYIDEVIFYLGAGASYIYGEYIIDDFEFENNGRRTVIRRRFSTNGFSLAPSLKVRSPFGDALAIDVLVNYNLLFMESRNSAELSLDHINIKLGLTLMF